MNLSDDEKSMVSDGLLELIENANSAKKLVHDPKVLEELDVYIEKVLVLLNKFCRE